MKTARHLVLCILMAGFFGLSSCSSKSTKYFPVVHDKPRVSTLGFRITPPPGKDWYEKHKNATLHYYKKTLPHTYLLTSKASEIKLDTSFSWQKDFIHFAKNKKAIFHNNTRYQNITFDYTMQDSLSEFCLRYRYMYEDHGDPGRGAYKFVQVKDVGLVCMHPDSPEVGIDISYVEKFIPEAGDPSYHNEGETFLSSLRFIAGVY